MTTHHFFDFEFVESPEYNDVMPISFGITNIDGTRELYLEFQFDEERAQKHDFVREVVLPLLEERPEDRLTIQQAADAIKDHFYGDQHVTLWAFFASYDFYLLCRCFGGMLNLPPMLPHAVMDLRQLMIHTSFNPAWAPKKHKTRQHHALVDARWDRDLGLKLFSTAREMGVTV